ncbi:substrate-binding domain-containing protein [Treponema sp. C6A8]|uniref:substrate-binding domain-containing protein n=1 Tax=Treponema sp. C6A8 TaxID=1410609 RepID=UPI000485CB44|nr:substrate-binding domain-containing protein [Treponema sp. C6A8]
MKKKLAVLSCGWSYDFLTDFISGIKRAVDEKDTDVYVFNCYNYVEFNGYINNSGFSIYNLINYEDYDGVIILSDLIQNARVLEKERQKILAAGKPAISINLAMKDISCLKVDNYTGAYELMTHLIKDHGLTDFAWIGGKETSIDIAERYKAYRTALNDNNIPINVENIHTIPTSSYNDAYEYLMTAMKAGATKPQAVVCANDYIALAVMKICEERGVKVPDQIKVIGYGDTAWGKTVVPSITTVRSNAEQVGFEAANRVLNPTGETQMLKIKSSALYRASCGCEGKSAPGGKSYALEIVDNLNQKEKFNTQIEMLNDTFSEATDVFSLLTNLEGLFQKSHLFEGSDFCIFLKADWSSVLINTEEKLPQNLSYGTQVQAIASIQNDKKYPREILNVRDLVPSKMITEGSSIFLFMPIYNHSYVHGYYVCKNCLNFLNSNFGYVWTKTFGNSIERFRKRNMFKQMSMRK